MLPIVGYDTLDEALAFINGRDRPLALYCFTNDRAARDKVLDGTISGGVTLNGTLLHQAQESCRSAASARAAWAAITAGTGSCASATRGRR